MKKILAAVAIACCSLLPFANINNTTENNVTISQQTVDYSDPKYHNVTNVEYSTTSESVTFTYDLETNVNGIGVTFDAYGEAESVSYVLYDVDGLEIDSVSTAGDLSCGDVEYATAGENKTFTVMKEGNSYGTELSSCYTQSTAPKLDSNVTYDVSFYTANEYYNNKPADGNIEEYIINTGQVEESAIIYGLFNVEDHWYTKWYWWVGIAAIVTGSLSIGLFAYDYINKKKNKKDINKVETNNLDDNNINKEETKNSI